MTRQIIYATLVIALATPSLVSAQRSEVPAPVKPPARVIQAVRGMFPGARTIEWKLKSDHFYEAEFTVGGVEIAAKFDSLGAWRETEKAAPSSALPASVKASISKNFSGYKVVETQTLVSVTRRDTLYELHFDNGREIVKAQLDAHGSIVSRSAKPHK